MTTLLEQGKDFSKSGDAYIGKTSDAINAFKGLQADLNYFAEKVGFDHVKVDGLVGAKTAAALRAVYDAVVASSSLLAGSLAIPESPESIAEMAPGARAWLDGVARSALSVGQHRRYHRGAGKDWNVKDAIAYGAGAAHEDFKALQADLNQFASVVGFPKLDVDGFLGPKTAAAVKSVYHQVAAMSSALEMTMFPVPDSKEEVAEYAQFIRGWLRDVATPKLLAEAPVA